MIIQLVSFLHQLPNKQRLKNTVEIINNSTADLILFPGHTLGFVNDIETLDELIENRKVCAILELQDINSDKINNCLFMVLDGKVINLFSNQLFSTSNEINNNYRLGERVLNEFVSRRVFEWKGFSFLIVQCGELNILKNLQSEGNKAEFRLMEDESLALKFNTILNKADVILNPSHTPMGNQGKMAKRREYLSNDEKIYFSTSNGRPGSENLNLKSMQYALKNGVEIREASQIVNATYISRDFLVKNRGAC